VGLKLFIELNGTPAISPIPQKVIHPTVKSHKWKSFFRTDSNDAGRILLLDFQLAGRKANNEIILAIFREKMATGKRASPRPKQKSFWRRKCFEFFKGRWFIFKMVPNEKFV